MNLYRKKYKELLDWKNKNHHFPIIIQGLRQIGKSYLAERFMKENYDEDFCPILDFRHDKSLKSIFKKEKGKIDLETIISNIKISFPDKQIVPNKTCIVMDEIGDCPEARESFKLFKDNSGYDIIATGSLLGLSEIKGEVNDVPTGFEEYLDLKPLDFEEFLIANNVSKDTIETIMECLNNFTPIQEHYHEVLNQYLLRYILVGGMPQAVLTFLETKDLIQVRKVLDNLKKDFRADFGKCKDKNGELTINSTLLIRTERAFDSIPDQLAKENKKFKYSCVPGGGRSSEFSDAINWLNKVNLISIAHNVRCIESPLKGNSITEEFKVFPTDIGILISLFPLNIIKDILNGNLGAYKGAIYEGLLADMQDKANINMFYFADSLKHLENDFLLESSDGILVIESKSKNGKMKSAKSLKLNETPFKIKEVYKVFNNNFGEGTYFKTMPFYAFSFFLQKINKELISDTILKDLPNI